jgi:hypothetical protein
MNLQRLLLVKLVILVISLVIVQPGFSQGKREESQSFSGYIESIPKNSKFVVVNEIRVFISSNTKIVDEKGNFLKIDNLKPGLLVAIEGIRKSDGISAGKITVMKSPKIKS